MGDPATAMRDPVFYRWHAMIDEIFQEHKATLPRYTALQLDFTGVRVTNVKVNVTGSARAAKKKLSTFWQKNDVDLSRGLDFTPRGSVFSRFKHLQHAPFSYRITIENVGAARVGTVRILLAPKADERGLDMLFIEQRHMFIEMDKFQANCEY